MVSQLRFDPLLEAGAPAHRLDDQDEEQSRPEGVAERRAVLDDALERITIRRRLTGRGLDSSLLSFQWVKRDQVGPWPVPSS